jgi:hypothetical protein
MAFESDLTEFFDPSEFGETITHHGSTINAMFFDVREEVEGMYINHTYCTMATTDAANFTRRDLIERGTIQYRIKSISDHNSDRSIKVVELEFIQDAS